MDMPLSPKEKYLNRHGIRYKTSSAEVCTFINGLPQFIGLPKDVSQKSKKREKVWS